VHNYLAPCFGSMSAMRNLELWVPQIVTSKGLIAMLFLLSWRVSTTLTITHT
jgi:hypothetical protein